MAKADTVEAPVRELDLNVGVEPPSHLFRREGAGRTRKATPFDDVVEDLYNRAVWSSVSATDANGNYDAEYAKELIAQINSAAESKGYGRRIRTDENDGTIYFKIQDKSKRGRPKGSKKGADGNFYAPGTEGYQEHVVNAGLELNEDDADDDENDE